jgi:hypothetical protein
MTFSDWDWLVLAPAPAPDYIHAEWIRKLKAAVAKGVDADKQGKQSEGEIAGGRSCAFKAIPHSPLG